MIEFIFSYVFLAAFWMAASLPVLAFLEYPMNGVVRYATNGEVNRKPSISLFIADLSEIAFYVGPIAMAAVIFDAAIITVSIREAICPSHENIPIIVVSNFLLRLGEALSYPLLIASILFVIAKVSRKVFQLKRMLRTHMEDMNAHKEDKS